MSLGGERMMVKGWEVDGIVGEARRQIRREWDGDGDDGRSPNPIATVHGGMEFMTGCLY